MKIAVKDFKNKEVGSIDLDPAIFGLEVRDDILHSMVNYQLNKRRAGTHSTKEIGDVRGTGKKPWAQKGTGRARQGSMRSPQFVGGAVIFTGVNTYTGTTTINAGATLALQGAGSIATSGDPLVNGTFDISGAASGASAATSLFPSSRYQPVSGR